MDQSMHGHKNIERKISINVSFMETKFKGIMLYLCFVMVFVAQLRRWCLGKNSTSTWVLGGMVIVRWCSGFLLLWKSKIYLYTLSQWIILETWLCQYKQRRYSYNLVWRLDGLGWLVLTRVLISNLYTSLYFCICPNRVIEEFERRYI